MPGIVAVPLRCVAVQWIGTCYYWRLSAYADSSDWPQIIMLLIPSKSCFLLGMRSTGHYEAIFSAGIITDGLCTILAKLGAVDEVLYFSSLSGKKLGWILMKCTYFSVALEKHI